MTSTSSVPSPTARWADEAAVRRVLEQYCRSLDDGRYSALLTMFTDDATFETMGRTLRGRDVIGEFLGPDQPSKSAPETAHVLSNVLVDISDEGDQATVESDWMMLRRTPTGATEIGLAGRYRDELTRTNGAGWQFVHRRAVTLAQPSTD